MTNEENTMGVLLLEGKKQRETIFGRIAETPVVEKKQHINTMAKYFHCPVVLVGVEQPMAQLQQADEACKC